jgi:hypothetical protein
MSEHGCPVAVEPSLAAPLDVQPVEVVGCKKLQAAGAARWHALDKLVTRDREQGAA